MLLTNCCFLVLLFWDGSHLQRHETPIAFVRTTCQAAFAITQQGAPRQASVVHCPKISSKKNTQCFCPPNLSKMLNIRSPIFRAVFLSVPRPRNDVPPSCSAGFRRRHWLRGWRIAGLCDEPRAKCHRLGGPRLAQVTVSSIRGCLVWKVADRSDSDFRSTTILWVIVENQSLCFSLNSVCFDD